LALPAIGALNLANRNSAKCIATAAHFIGQPHKFACPGSINDIYLNGGHSGLEFCVGVSQSIEHMFEYKTGVGHSSQLRGSSMFLPRAALIERVRYLLS
jgi:hypothetical protein